MTDKQQIFIERYLLHFNATKAAQEAGYSLDTASNIGHENLRKPEIKAVIDERVKEIICQSDDKRAKLIHFWDSVINDEEESTHVRLKAADSLGKYLAMFVDRIEHTGEFKPVEFVIHSKVERE